MAKSNEQVSDGDAPMAFNRFGFPIGILLLHRMYMCTLIPTQRGLSLKGTQKI